MCWDSCQRASDTHTKSHGSMHVHVCSLHTNKQTCWPPRPAQTHRRSEAECASTQRAHPSQTFPEAQTPVTNEHRCQTRVSSAMHLPADGRTCRVSITHTRVCRAALRHYICELTWTPETNMLRCVDGLWGMHIPPQPTCSCTLTQTHRRVLGAPRPPWW